MGHHVIPTRPGERQHLDRISTRRRIAARPAVITGKFFDVVAEQSEAEHGFSRVHPVDVPRHGVDLAVVQIL